MKKFLAAALLTAGFYAPALAANPMAGSSYLTGYTGAFDVLDEDDRIQFGIEYRMQEVGYGLRPTLGFNFDDDSAMYGYGGLNLDFAVGRFYVTPNFMIGAYSKGSNGKDLGGALEFRSGIEVSYLMENNHRLGVAFNHISNARIYDSNPGAEALLINYSVPVGSLMNW